MMIYKLLIAHIVRDIRIIICILYSITDLMIQGISQEIKPFLEKYMISLDLQLIFKMLLEPNLCMLQLIIVCNKKCIILYLDFLLMLLYGKLILCNVLDLFLLYCYFIFFMFESHILETHKYICMYTIMILEYEK